MKKQRIKRKKERKQFKLGDLIIPVLGFVVFVLLTNFIYVPMINEASDLREREQVLEKKETTLLKLQKTLDEVDRSQMNSDYAMVMQVIPEALEVANFAAHVEKVALEKHVQLSDLLASDFDYVLDEGEGLKSVSGPVTAKGLYDNIIEFVDGLQTNSSYLITVGNMQLKDGGHGEWQVDLSIEARYIATEQLDKNDIRRMIYLPYTSYTNKNELLTTLRSRVQGDGNSDDSDSSVTP